MKRCPLDCATQGTATNSGMQDIGRVLVIVGFAFVLLGAALWSGLGAGWLGRLPGDIRVERGQTAFYFPIVTCIIVSVVLSLLMSLFRR
ncbi:MAG TPA: DUF2905 domain-containing protein [Chthoniobacterales bacterium]